MSNSKTSAREGIGLGSLLGVLFIVLKLLDKIDWPWIWVLSPFWIPLGIIVGIVVIIVTIVLIIVLYFGTDSDTYMEYDEDGIDRKVRIE